MRFEVPQFIEVEDKIFGPFTWKQFIYLAGGLGFLILLFFLLPFLLFILIGTPIGVLTGFLTFHRVNNRPFSVFLESLVTYFSKNKLYLWRKDQEQSVIEHPTESNSLGNPVEHTQKRRLSSLAQRLSLNTLEK
jgi:hypothetical protein